MVRSMKMISLLAMHFSSGGALVTREPASEHMFSQIDVDGDRLITVEEAQNFYTGMQGMTAAKAVERVSDILKNFDLDGDGKFDKDEYVSILSRLRDDSTVLANGADQETADEAEAEDEADDETEDQPPGMKSQFDRVFRQSDGNGDGKIDKTELKDLFSKMRGSGAHEAELSKMVENVFKNFDKNGDGLDKDEYMAYKQSQGSR
eukprot:TRINITY_DN71_c0_g1_i4.p1 TRINITY_DN71_c0_g1~~TRINITY_DN71_c0_g1_i4.p1  ORF type:complete len:205 (-),score=51.04 TRINITY_DN71_c0_g1_i4:211-825(-)